ncbi:(R)-stereoselective amidase (plasmid) [Variovorax sp. SRS16]|uniref:carbon-nitrogen hydrolase family protein n=1 Tax=Variovorax sp. SRS16 TaxID=282217 RepID=UPI001317E940|nr:carbon-nitrogen hydrolase family protein [Variovorax sp. SRS16]VTU46750.1 (R)-stereoselective amidase [Variovorax sp. SRS16]
MKVSLIQMNSVADKARNVADAHRLARKAVEIDGAELVVFPEHFDWAGGSVAEKVAAGEDVRGGPAYDMCQRLARDCQIHVHSGSFYETAAGLGRVYNTTVIFNPEGEEIGRYRKIHLFDIHTPDGLRYGESDSVLAGSETCVIDIHGFRMGLAICYDIRFPELFQKLMRDGADVIVLPAAFTLQTGKDHWEVLCRARAIETQCYFLAAAQIGALEHNGETRYTYGHSLFCDPWGHVIARASDQVGIVSARLDRGLIAKTRKQIPLAQHKVL